MGTKIIIKYFITWRVMLQIILLLSVAVLPLQMNFLGGGLSNYLDKPYLWGWANFDGEHYLALAKFGYQPLTYFFFPLYPILIRAFEEIVAIGDVGYLASGLIVSNTAFLVGLVGLVRLIKLDYSEKLVRSTLLLLLLFPTSFYFGAVYTEGLFFALVIWSFYNARKGNWLWAGVLGALATGTRLVGVALLPALLIEYFLRKKRGVASVVGILLIPLGLAAYMGFLWVKTGDPLEFLHSIGVFGEQRSSSLITLPQVFYRYIFKIIPNLNWDYFPVVFTTLQEIITAVVFGGLSVFGLLGRLGKLGSFTEFRKIPLSYIVYLILGYLIPTLSGSFSSLPRYVLVLFPGFILMAIYINKLPKIYTYFIYTLLFLMLTISTALFVRGYWIS